MARAMLPASQRCPAHQAFADAFKGGKPSAKDAAMELYELFQAAESIYQSAPDGESRHHVAAEIIGGAHIIAHHLNAIREMGRGLVAPHKGLT